jgi:hypothetical protein
MQTSDFLFKSEDGYTAILTREQALKIIKAMGLEKVELTCIRYGTLYFALSHMHEWCWDTTLIERELNKFSIPLIRKELEFYVSTVDSYPLFILKEGWDKAVCVAPHEFTMDEEEE